VLVASALLIIQFELFMLGANDGWAGVLHAWLCRREWMKLKQHSLEGIIQVDVLFFILLFF
jgi:hypothetical protein